MSWLSMCALVFGVLGVWLTIQQHILCWAMALISVVTSALEFYNEKLYGDMSLQVFYFFAGIYGWILWKKKSKKEFVITNMNSGLWWIMIIATFIQSLIYYYLIIYFKGDRPVLDSVLTACSLTTTYMMTKKYVENWLVWTIIDFVYIFLYGLKHMWIFAILYGFFGCIAFYGWLKWKRVTILK